MSASRSPSRVRDSWPEVSRTIRLEIVRQHIRRQLQIAFQRLPLGSAVHIGAATIVPSALSTVICEMSAATASRLNDLTLRMEKSIESPGLGDWRFNRKYDITGSGSTAKAAVAERRLRLRVSYSAARRAFRRRPPLCSRR